MIATPCFAYADDTQKVMHEALGHLAVVGIVELVNAHPSLLFDLSELLRLTESVEGDVAPRISERYRDRYNGKLTPQQEKLVTLIDELYATSDKKALAARRGAVLERIVHTAVQSRASTADNDTVVLNAKSIALTPRHTPINHYSVDVAACFPARLAAEFYACKLQAAYMTADDLLALVALGTYFRERNRKAGLCFCCLQRRKGIRSRDLQRLASYPEIMTYTVDNLAQLWSKAP